MKSPRRILASATFLVVFVFVASAFAQTPGPVSPPTLTPTVGVVMVLSMLLGVLNNWIQTGTVLGRWIPPQAWLPDVTMIATALGGFLGYVTSQNPVSLSGTAIFYSVMAAVAALIAGAAPTVALHVHATLTAARREALKLAAKAAGVLALIGALVSTQTACNQPLFPLLQKVEQVVVADLEQNKTPPQIDSDVCQALGGTATTDAICADVTTLVTDAIEALIATGVIKSPTATGAAKTYLAAHPRGALTTTAPAAK